MSRPTSKQATPLTIAAIDFGTTGTGYAYKLRKQDGASSVGGDQGWTGITEVGLQEPTTVLMKPNQEFHSFGSKAEAEYKNLTLHNNHRDWYYFRHFKMKLHHEKVLTEDMPLKEASGKKMKAINVFAAAIKYVKEDLLRKLRSLDIYEQDVSWVLTVPAIWRESAKQFMRLAAETAGIPSNQLMLAKEPESAAIYCKDQFLTRTRGIDNAYLRAFDPGEKYLVIDCGGGTVDTTGHEVMANGHLKELYAATGGPWGGELVNDNFMRFMENMLSKEVMDEFRSRHATEYIEFESNFEKEKKAYTRETNVVLLTFPQALQEIYERKKKTGLAKSLGCDRWRKYVNKTGNFLELQPCLMNELFDGATDEISRHIETLMRKPELEGIKTLLFVGGFSQHPVLGEAMRRRFEGQGIRVIIPTNASKAILNGAVMYGTNPDIIALRISPFTYGVHTRMPYNRTKHAKYAAKQVGSKLFLDNAFDKHLTVGESVYIGQTKNARKYLSYKNVEKVYWDVYQSEHKDPVLCSDLGCQYIGKLLVSMPPDIKEERVSLTLTMTCMGSELEAKVEATDKRIKCTAKFDFLNTQTGGSTIDEEESPEMVTSD